MNEEGGDRQNCMTPLMLEIISSIHVKIWQNLAKHGLFFQISSMK
jgi:hypothetical protein